MKRTLSFIVICILCVSMFSVLVLQVKAAITLSTQYDYAWITPATHKYCVQNNVWNPVSGWKQGLQVDDQTGAFTVIESNANNPTNELPVSYPSIYRGNHWGIATINSVLPIQVSVLSVDTSWSFSTVSSGAWDAAYDVWFHQTSDYIDGRPNGAELMIWLNYQGGVQPAGSNVNTVSLAGATWEVWRDNTATPQITSYRITTKTTSASFNLNTFVADAVARGYISNSWYLVSVEAGFELWQGGVGLTSNSFSVRVSIDRSNPYETRYGFWPYWIDASTYEPNWNSLTHVSYFSMDANPDGTLDTTKLGSNYGLVRDAAHSRGVEVTLAVTTHDHNKMDYDHILAYYKDDIAANILQKIQIYDADGVCLDFEGVNNHNFYTGESNKVLMEQLMEALHDALKTADSTYHISFCVQGWTEEVYRNGDLSGLTDAVFLMGYDFHSGGYSSDPSQTWAHYTGPNSPYNDPLSFDVKDAVELLDNYYPTHKIILGVPFYGWDWESTSSEPYCERLPSNGIAITMANAIPNAETYGRLWDSRSNTPWYRYQTGGVWHQCWYDDEESIEIKHMYVKSNNLAGIGFWALGHEGNDADIWNVIGARAHKLDLIFAIDVTGSMWDDIAAVKASASEIVETIHSKVTGYRIAVVSYRDFPVSPYGSHGDWPYKDVLGFSSDETAIIAAIQSLYVGGGADWEESVYSALMHSIDSTSLGGWRGSDEAAKVIILMGDAPPHDPEPFTGYTLSTVIDAAEKADPVHVYPIQIGGTVSRFEEIAEQTGGRAFTAESAEEVVSTILEALEVIAEAPVAEAGPDQTVFQGDTVILEGSGSNDPDGTIVLYEWDAEGDGTYEWSSSTTGMTTYVYETTGTYYATLRITDNDGLQDTDFAIITVEKSPDEIPPTTTLLIGEPHYVDPIDKVYISSVTPFTLTAEDNPSGTGVASTSYRIYNATYDTGWLEYSAPFYLTGLSDDEYSIDYYSTDNIGNTEATNTAAVVLDNTGPLITVSNPPAGWALQDGVTFLGSLTDAGSGVSSMSFSIREQDGGTGTQIGYEDLPVSYDPATGQWSFFFDTLLVPDGYYLLYIEAEDNLGNEASTTVPYSIRNWAVIELLPSSEDNKAGRTMPVKFALRVAAEVDANQPFVYNEELRIEVFATADPDNVLQESYYGNTARDYRISSVLYITNFKTTKRKPMEYTVAIYRDTFDVGSFTFETVK